MKSRNIDHNIEELNKDFSKNKRNSSEFDSVNYQLMWVDMKMAGLSLQKVAMEIGVSKQAVWRWLQGYDTPKMMNLVNFANAVGKDPRDYVDDIYKAMILRFERKMAVDLRSDDDNLQGVTKGDIQLVRVLKQIDALEDKDKDDDEDDNLSDNPLHRHLIKE